MRLTLFDRIRRLVRPRRPEAAGTAPQGRHRRGHRRLAGYGPPAAGGEPPAAGPASAALAGTGADVPDAGPAPGVPAVTAARPGQARAGPGSPAVRAGGARARIREAPGQPAADLASARYQAPPPAELAETADQRSELADQRAEAPDQRAEAADQRAEALARVASGAGQQTGRPSWRAAQARLLAKLPFVTAHAPGRPRTGDGRRNCGSLEPILWRQWDAAHAPPPEVIEAIDRLAELPEQIKERLASGLDWIFVGPGGVPELDEMTALRGVPLPSGQASWDACAGAYGDRKIVVGSRPSPTPDVMCHEVGHALDDLDSPPGKWQSDSAQFRILYDQCQPHLASDFHRQPGGLGRKEFFADAFAAIASGQRPALVDMLSGDTRTALRVMLYFNRRYGI
jgi:hypothetical protein